MDHDGTVLSSVAEQFGWWAKDVARRADKLHWLRRKGSPERLVVTPKGKKALAQALSDRRTPESGGAIPDTLAGVRTIRPRWETLSHLQEGLNVEEFASVVRAVQTDNYESEYKPHQPGFPGSMFYATTLSYGEDSDHPFSNAELNPAGYAGRYVVSMTLRRQGAPDNPKTIVMDDRSMEGDSHLRLPNRFVDQSDAGKKLFLSVQYATHEGELLDYQLLPNQWGRLGKIRIEITANDAEDAIGKSYRHIMPVLCDLAYRYDVPLDILQINAVERATLTHTVSKMEDFREAILSEDPFQGTVDYEELPLYPVFTYLYREGLNSSNIAYSFLCFYRIIEGIRVLRRARGSTSSGSKYEDEVIEGNMMEHFPSEFHGKRFGYVVEKSFAPLRQKIAHAFVESKKFSLDSLETLTSKLEIEGEYNSNRTMAREIVRAMMHNEYWKRTGD